MSEPTVEEVREALKFAAINTAEVHTLAKAARLWVDVAEPDIEAAIRTLDNEFRVGEPEEWMGKIIAAAFGDNNLIRRAE